MFSFVRLLPSLQFGLGSCYADCPHNALYNESVHGREEHATWINSIPLKIATLLTLQNFEVGLYFRERYMLIVSATSRHYSVLRGLARRTLRWPLRYGNSVQPSIRLSNSLGPTLDFVYNFKKKGKGSFYIAQYPVRWTAQSALHFLPSLTDLFIPTQTRLLLELEAF